MAADLGRGPVRIRRRCEACGLVACFALVAHAKVKLVVTEVEATRARVTEGAIDPTRMGKGKKVVLRAREPQL